MTTADTPAPERRILVAYASRNGATEEIAAWLGERLRARAGRAEVTVAEASDRLDPVGYDAVVLGSALYEGRWLRSAARFARRYRHELAERWVWTFSSGPLDDSASTGEVPMTHSADRISRRLLARDHVTFGGRLSADARGWLGHAMVQSGLGGDYRDRAQIDAFADRIADELSVLPMRHTATA
ncbi:flavodoxin domain-containing protein [Streptacidiphilus neutrinimicus]|uniref:flavodoxin domain-containing protein n=1 Tax=Streptacidiphilus neutrinimicus TaxID=105420 RepID=UPI0005A9DDF1|nr:flavodoxin domain-containing protein [Streptacidiphilus neutrinimicus]